MQPPDPADGPAARRARERQVFDAAVLLPVEQRAAKVHEACRDDPELERRLLRLLAAHTESEGMTGGLTGQLLAMTDPERIGPYRILERIGTGGMGVVYLAEQSSPIQRRVALKLVRAGMRTEDVLARFRAERQALARMDHPCIARIYDSGAAESDLPYFVMEYVPGEPLMAWCDRQRMSLRRRIELFVQITRAVQHAHTKGIVHRDLKPSNVLVGEVDEQPVPKVIDFGVARAIDRDGEDAALMTQAGNLIGTPAYMSPEQFAYDSADIDTRADIYSLGVMLYELLTGVLPSAADGSAAQPFHEVRRAVLEVEPQRPSTRIQKQGEAARSAAARRSETPNRLATLLRGDLDRVVMKALAKDRAMRYATAEELARDLERYLADEPVTATPPSRIYLMRKFVARHRRLVVACALLLVSLLLGLIGTGVGLARAEEQRVLADERSKVATAAAARASAARDFLTKMLASANPLESLRKNVRVVDLLHDAVARLDAGEFDADADVHFELRETLGTALSCVDDHAAAERQFRRAIELLPLTVSSSADAALRLQIELGEVLAARGDYSAALDVATAALATLHARGDDPLTVRATVLAGNTSYNLGAFPAAKAQLAKAIAMHERLAGPRTEYGAELRIAFAFHLTVEGELDEALKELEVALDVLGDSSAQGRVKAAQALRQRATIRMDQHLTELAETDLLQALKIREQLFDDGSAALAEVLHDLGQLELRRGRPEPAEQYLTRALEMRRKQLGDHRDTANTLMFLAGVSTQQRRFDAALAFAEEGLAMRRRVFAADSPAIGEALKRLGAIHARIGDLELAERLQRDALDNWLAALGEEHPDVASARYELAQTLRKRGKLEEAEPLLLAATARRATTYGEASPQANQARDELIVVQLLAEHWADAEQTIRTSIAAIRAARPNGSLLLDYLDAQLGAARLGQGHADEARTLLVSAWKALGDDPKIWATNKLFIAEHLSKALGQLGEPEEAARYRAIAEDLRGQVR